MDFKTLENLINETAAQTSTNPSLIVEDLSEIVKLKYGIAILEKERILIDEVKTKIFTKLYNLEDHACSTNLNLAKTFKLDMLENDYLNSAMNELQHEGIVKNSKTEITLTKEGIMKFKEFYGEI